MRASLPLTRHARPCAGHPRLGYRAKKDVDGRDKPGHDEEETLVPKPIVAIGGREFMVDRGGASYLHQPIHYSFVGFASRSLNLWIFPVAVFGRDSTTSIQRGYFQTPIFC